MSRLNYHHLYYFWQVAVTGNLTRTAEQLHISQSALSTQIRNLEDNLECQLFDREGRKLVLTEAGQRAMQFAEDIFHRGAELESLLRLGVSSANKRLRIGTTSHMSRNFIEEFIGPAMQDAEASVSLVSDNQNKLVDDLTRHELDVVLTNANVEISDNQAWQIQLLSRQPVAIVCPPALATADLKAHSWVLPSRKHAIRGEFDAFCLRRGFSPTLKAEVDDMAMLRLMARDSQAFAVLPRVVAKDELATGRLVEREALTGVYERFYAITVERIFKPELLDVLLAGYD
ncbi:MAG: LysR family transcriptional activator of nhaA [Halopseudomonas sp.]|jgi:LysR family transcriptional activator of nhaA|uniref:LysR family transcriptional regulator n=1 Tax=Halopseudomonas sp. TaxID=2901191 RepID=UPI0039E46C17